MTSETIRFLLRKLPKKMLIESIINTYEALFEGDPEGLKKAYHEQALIIQAWAVVHNKTTIDQFSEPFKSELQEYIDTIYDNSKQKETDLQYGGNTDED